jgi:predicted transcriptional regulator
MAKELPTIAKNVKKYRDKLGISQDKLSKMAGVTLHTIAKIETVQPLIPALKRFAKLQMPLALALMI